MRKTARGEPRARHPLPRPRSEKREFPRAAPPVRPTEPFRPTRPVVLLDKKQTKIKLNISSDVTLWDYIRTGRVPEGIVMGPDNGKLKWIEEQLDEVIVNAPRRKPKGSTVAS